MANIESKNLLTVLKANARAKKLPLDYTEVWESLSEAQNYLANPTAYAGQTIKVLDGGEYKTFTLQPNMDGTSLYMKEVGAITMDDIKDCVVVTSALPEAGMQNVLYINTTDNTGYIWDGTKFVEAFANVQVKVNELRTELMEVIDTKAPIDNPTFTGAVTLAGDPNSDMEAVTKRYVDALITNLENNTTPGLVNSESPLPTEGYQAGMTFRVSEAGTYAGSTCEIGDLIIVLKDYVAESASDADFMVVQANIDGAVTGPESATNLNIAIFDGATGKVIKDSEVGIESLNDAIAKAHVHENEEVLDTFDMTQEEILADAQAKATAVKDELTPVIDGKAEKATTLEGYGITDAYTTTQIDDKLGVINQNLNTKLDQAAVQAIADAAKDAAIETAGTNAQTALDEKVGEIGEVTVKEYVDTAVSGAQTTLEAQIETSATTTLNAAKEYADQAEVDAVASAKNYTDDAKTAAISAANEYTDAAKTAAQTYADGVGSTTLASAQEYADQAEADAVASAKSYTDGVQTAVQEYADQAEADAIAAAKNYTDAAKTAAQEYADGVGSATLASAQEYADQAEVDAVASAKSYSDGADATTLASAQEYADQAEADAIAAAKEYVDGANKVIVF